jgi:pyruvate-formate lyase-activating enzyme
MTDRHPAGHGFFEKVCFVITLRCNIACDHCMPESGPRQRATVPAAELGDWIEQAGRLGVRTVSLTGGEPFVVPALLRSAVATARDAGMGATVMSNGFWATSVARGVEVLEPLEGLQGVGLSTDRFHWASVPVERVRNAIAAARGLDREVLVRVTYTAGGEDEIREVRERLGASLSDVDVFETVPVLAFGRARRTIPPRGYFPIPVRSIPCRVADAPTVSQTGVVYACCGPSMLMHPDSALRLGDLRAEPLAAIHDRAQRNVALHIVRTAGPGGLLDEIERRLDRAPDASCDGICGSCWKSFADAEARAIAGALDDDAVLSRATAIRRLTQLGEAEGLAPTAGTAA